MKLKIVFAISFLFISSLALARTEPYSSTNAVKYARSWVSNNGTLRNPSYISFSSDCTNFVSQALKAGGFRNIGSTSTSDQSWYYNNSKSYSQTWSVANSLYSRFKNGYEGWYLNSGTSSTSSANYGDIIFARWGSNLAVGHAMLVTGFAYNPNTRFYEPTLSYHSSDVKDIPMSTFLNRVKRNYGAGVSFYRFSKLNYCSVIQSNQIVPFNSNLK